jgi:hypothetical protein
VIVAQITTTPLVVLDGKTFAQDAMVIALEITLRGISSASLAKHAAVPRKDSAPRATAGYRA